MKKKLIIGNWKMKPSTLAEAKKIFTASKRAGTRAKKSTVVVCPPHIYLGALSGQKSLATSFALGAQDVYWSNKGSHTGEVSPEMLKKIGAKYVIVGHSERRKGGETDDMIAEKLKAVLSEGMTPILCVGEHERDGRGAYLNWLSEQINASLSGISRQKIGKVILAYEPLWAIGRSAKDAIDADTLHQTILFIRKVLVKRYDRKAGESVKVLYGGSVEQGNAGALIQTEGVDGFLIGHASLVPEDFTEIIKTVEHI